MDMILNQKKYGPKLYVWPVPKMNKLHDVLKLAYWYAIKQQVKKPFIVINF